MENRVLQNLLDDIGDELGYIHTGQFTPNGKHKLYTKTGCEFVQMGRGYLTVTEYKRTYYGKIEYIVHG